MRTAASTPPGASTRTASSTSSTGASRRASTPPQARGCGPRSGCCPRIRLTAPGPPAGNSTSWRCSLATRAPSTRPRFTTAWRGRSTPSSMKSTWKWTRPTVFTSTHSNGTKPRFAGSWTERTTTPSGTPPTGTTTWTLRRTPMSRVEMRRRSTSPSTCCSTSPSGGTCPGPPPRMRCPRNCASTTCAFTSAPSIPKPAQVATDSPTTRTPP